MLIKVSIKVLYSTKVPKINGAKYIEAYLMKCTGQEKGEEIDF